MNTQAIVEPSAVSTPFDIDDVESAPLQLTIEEIDHRENAASYYACCAFIYNR